VERFQYKRLALHFVRLYIVYSAYAFHCREKTQNVPWLFILSIICSFHSCDICDLQFWTSSIFLKMKDDAFDRGGLWTWPSSVFDERGERLAIPIRVEPNLFVLNDLLILER
jgi:hypothetical protein